MIFWKIWSFSKLWEIVKNPLIFRCSKLTYHAFANFGNSSGAEEIFLVFKKNVCETLVNIMDWCVHSSKVWWCSLKTNWRVLLVVFSKTLSSISSWLLKMILVPPSCAFSSVTWNFKTNPRIDPWGVFSQEFLTVNTIVKKKTTHDTKMMMKLFPFEFTTTAF